MDTLQTLVVTRYRFLDKDVSGITNLPLRIEQVPQSISLVNNSFVKAADLKTMGEVAQYTAGALWASYSPSYGNQVWLRGFPAGWAIDGLTVGDQITEPDVATLERYEIVKGPASVVYGAQSPGGIINLVSKRASLDAPSYLDVTGGSWGRLRFEGQGVTRLNRSGTIRAIGVAAYQRGGSFVDFVKLKKSVAYGGLDFDVAPGVTAYVRAGYQETENTPYNGLPTFADGTLLPLPRSFFIGGSQLNNIAKATRVNAGLTWKASDLWSFDVKGVYQHTTHAGQNAYNYDYIAQDGSFPFGGENFDDWFVNDYQVGASVLRKLDDAGLHESSVSANVRYQHYRYYIYERFLSGGTANIYDGDEAISNLFNAQIPGTGNYRQDQNMNYLTASSQAVVKVAKPLTLVGGIAYSRPTIDLQLNGGPLQTFDPGNQVNFRGAAVLEAAAGLNLYASYGESYQPNLRIDINGNVLPPLNGKQYEVGAKYAPDSRLLITAAAFNIDESNVAVFDTMVNGEALYRAKGVRHRGVELEASGRLTDHWQVKAGFSVLDATVTLDPESPINDGERRPWLPKVGANLFTSYTFDDGLSVIGGARYTSSVKTYDTSSPTVTPDIASYALVDAGVGYSIGRFHFQANLKNIFDKHYAVASPIFQSLSAGLYPGEPRSLAVSSRAYF